jgi:putative tricarboxylic transport membrane protein
MTGDRISSLFGLLCALYIVMEGVALDVGGLHQPGPGFFPVFGGILLGVFSIIHFVRSMRAPSVRKGRKGEGDKENPVYVIFIFVGLLVYTFILDWVGFILCTFLLLAILLKAFDRQQWWKVLVTAGVASCASYVVFAVLLKSPLPKGILEIFL